MIITSGILLAALIQAGIYLRQFEVMQASLEQNERGVILGRGQIAVANRNAKTAEDTLAEMKSGGADTHALAEAARDSADTLLASERGWVKVPSYWKQQIVLARDGSLSLVLTRIVGRTDAKPESRGQNIPSPSGSRWPMVSWCLQQWAAEP